MAMANFNSLFEDALERMKEREEHQKKCTAVPCEECGRLACPRCHRAAPTDDHPCAECMLSDQLDAVRASVPKRFRWALNTIPEQLAGAIRLDAPPASKVKICAALAWARGPNPSGLLLRGPSKAGKTTLAVAMFGAWLDAHRDPEAVFATADSLSLERQHHPLGQGEAPAIARAIAGPLLVLDDMGTEHPSRSDVIRYVVFARHDAELPTWITTWMSDDEMGQRYGVGAQRRIVERAKLVELGGSCGPSPVPLVFGTKE